MNKVVYYSRSGNTKMLADAIAEAAGTIAVSVDKPESEINEPVDVLFVGGALYAYGLDKHLSDWLERLDGSKVGKAAVFSTSWLSKHSVDLIKNGLKAKGIAVEEDYFWNRSKPSAKNIEGVKAFAKKHIG